MSSRVLSSKKKGVYQGCVLSLILFYIYGKYIMRKTLEDKKEGVTVGSVKISNLRYADDTTMFASSEKNFRFLNSLATSYV